MFGEELIRSLQKDIERNHDSIADRERRIMDGRTDMDDCFLSQHNDEFMLRGARQKIALLKSGGLAWFRDYQTLEGFPVKAKWVQGAWGERLRVYMPDGKTVWTSAKTAKGLAKNGLKAVAALRPAWFKIDSQGLGTETWTMFPSDKNYATGKPAGSDPVEVMDWGAYEEAGHPQPWDDLEDEEA